MALSTKIISYTVIDYFEVKLYFKEGKF